MAWLSENPEVVVTELEDGAVLLHLETRLYYSLNESGLEVWRRIGSAVSSEDLIRALADRYDVDEERARKSVSRFVEELERERLVVSASGDTGGNTAIPPPTADGPGKTAKPTFAEPALIRHEEPLHEITMSPFDPQLPLAE